MGLEVGGCSLFADPSGYVGRIVISNVERVAVCWLRIARLLSNLGVILCHESILCVRGSWSWVLSPYTGSLPDMLAVTTLVDRLDTLDPR